MPRGSAKRIALFGGAVLGLIALTAAVTVALTRSSSDDGERHSEPAQSSENEQPGGAQDPAGDAVRMRLRGSTLRSELTQHFEAEVRLPTGVEVSDEGLCLSQEELQEESGTPEKFAGYEWGCTIALSSPSVPGSVLYGVNSQGSPDTWEATLIETAGIATPTLAAQGIEPGATLSKDTSSGESDGPVCGPDDPPEC